MGRDGFPWYRATHRAWYAWVHGRQRRLSGDKQEAFRVWHLLQAEPAGGESLGALIDRYLQAVSVRPSTLLTKRQILSRVPRSEDSATFDAASWINRHPSWGPGYRWLVASALKSMYKWAKLLNESLDSLKLPSPRSRGVDALVSDEEHEALIDGAPQEYRDALEFLRETGCRPGELCSASVDNLVVPPGVILLTDHKTAYKTSAPRLIVLSDKALSIATRLKGERKEGPLFRSTIGGPLHVKRLHEWMMMKCKRLKMRPLFPYAYRHTFATDKLAGGVADALVAQLLGHKGTHMLHKHYSHLTARIQALKDALRGDLKGVGDVFPGIG